MNQYRVDRANSTVVPVGMNSILYIGDDWTEARKVFASAKPGKDAWGKPNSTYGVILSVWRGSHSVGEYVMKCQKGL